MVAAPLSWANYSGFYAIFPPFLFTIVAV